MRMDVATRTRNPGFTRLRNVLSDVARVHDASTISQFLCMPYGNARRTESVRLPHLEVVQHLLVVQLVAAAVAAAGAAWGLRIRKRGNGYFKIAG